MPNLLSAASAFFQSYVLFPAAQAATTTNPLTAAQTNLTEVGKGAGVSSSPELPQLLGNFIRVGIGVLGILLVLYFVLGGFKYLQSAGAKDKVDEAKKIMTHAVVGLIIILAAYSIANFVITQLTQTGVTG